jgi:hypothetical protein
MNLKSVSTFKLLKFDMYLNNLLNTYNLENSYLEFYNSKFEKFYIILY